MVYMLLGTGFEETEAFSVENNSIVGSIICNETAEEACFGMTVTLENGVQLEADLFGYVSGGFVYLNVNSMFCARDVYWAEMLNSGARTYAEYEA